MNILTDPLPETVKIGGVEVPICTDFRVCLRVMLAFEDPELTNYEKQAVLLSNLYPWAPPDMGKAIEQAIVFLNGGEERAESDAPRLFSFSKDANLIFAAFQQTHSIDLTIAELHWWKFLALFMDLGSETAFCNLVALRKRVKDGTATKEEKQAAWEMGETFEIPELDDRTLEEREREAEFMKQVRD